MHSNMSLETLCGLLFMSSNLNQRAARSGITEQYNTCLIVFLHNAADPVERVLARVSAYRDRMCHFL